MKLARHRGARTLAITDATHLRGRRARRADALLLVQQPLLHPLDTALMALVQALAHGVYARDEAAHKDRIRAYKLK